MARIRTIKPEFWGDEKMAALDPLTRLVFLGLISLADDRGRLLDNLKFLDGQLFPVSDESCAKPLDTLAALLRIQRYTSESGQSLIQIVNWGRHQKVDKPSKYSLPAPPGRSDLSSRDTREVLATDSRETRAPTYDLRPTTSDRRSSDRRGEGILIAAELLSKRIESRTGRGEVRYNIPIPIVESMPEPVRRALKAIGGPYEFANADEKRRSVLLGQFATAYAAAVSACEGSGPGTEKRRSTDHQSAAHVEDDVAYGVKKTVGPECARP
jgi:hypothetical protein